MLMFQLVWSKPRLVVFANFPMLLFNSSSNFRNSLWGRSTRATRHTVYRAAQGRAGPRQATLMRSLISDCKGRFESRSQVSTGNPYVNTLYSWSVCSKFQHPKTKSSSCDVCPVVLWLRPKFWRLQVDIRMEIPRTTLCFSSRPRDYQSA